MSDIIHCPQIEVLSAADGDRCRRLTVFDRIQLTSKRSATALRQEHNTGCCDRAQAGCGPERLFRISRSSWRMRASRRSRAFSWTRLKPSFHTTSVSRCACSICSASACRHPDHQQPVYVKAHWPARSAPHPCGIRLFFHVPWPVSLVAVNAIK